MERQPGCRLCLQECTKVIDIFKDDFPRMIYQLTKLKVSIDDQLPRFSCIDCALEVKQAIATRRKILISHRTLLNERNSISKIPPSPNAIIRNNYDTKTISASKVPNIQTFISEPVTGSNYIVNLTNDGCGNQVYVKVQENLNGVQGNYYVGDNPLHINLVGIKTDGKMVIQKTLKDDIQILKAKDNVILHENKNRETFINASLEQGNLCSSVSKSVAMDQKNTDLPANSKKAEIPLEIPQNIIVQYPDVMGSDSNCSNIEMLPLTTYDNKEESNKIDLIHFNQTNEISSISEDGSHEYHSSDTEPVLLRCLKENLEHISSFSTNLPENTPETPKSHDVGATSSSDMDPLLCKRYLLENIFNEDDLANPTEINNIGSLGGDMEKEQFQVNEDSCSNLDLISLNGLIQDTVEYSALDDSNSLEEQFAPFSETTECEEQNVLPKIVTELEDMGIKTDNQDDYHDNINELETLFGKSQQIKPSAPPISKRRMSNCMYCSKFVSNFARHLVRLHKDEDVVKKILSLKHGDPQRKELIAFVRKTGNYIKSDETKVIRPTKRCKESQPTSDEYVPCPDCLGYLKKAYLRVHRRRCSLRSMELLGRNNHLTQAQLQQVRLKNCDFYDSLRLTEEVFLAMRADVISKTAMEDVLICLFGESLIKKRCRKPFIISNKIRQLGRLLISLRKRTSLESLLEHLAPEYFSVFVEATKEISGYNSENKTYASESLAQNLGFSLKRVCDKAIELIRDKNQYLECDDEDVKVHKIKLLRDKMDNSWISELNIAKERNNIPVIMSKNVLKSGKSTGPIAKRIRPVAKQQEKPKNIPKHHFKPGRQLMKRRFTEKQKILMKDFFRKHIEEKRPPKKNEVLALMRSNSPLFELKTWAQIKAFVYNEYRDK